MAMDLRLGNFDAEIAQDVPTIVDFWASWCGPCRAQAPILEKLESEPNLAVRVCKVNVDEEEELARRFGIMTIPTLIVFRRGKEYKRVSGTQQLEALKKLVSDIV